MQLLWDGKSKCTMVRKFGVSPSTLSGARRRYQDTVQYMKRCRGRQPNSWTAICSFEQVARGTLTKYEILRLRVQGALRSLYCKTIPFVWPMFIKAKKITHSRINTHPLRSWTSTWFIREPSNSTLGGNMGFVLILQSSSRPYYFGLLITTCTMTKKNDANKPHGFLFPGCHESPGWVNRKPIARIDLCLLLWTINSTCSLAGRF